MRSGWSTTSCRSRTCGRGHSRWRCGSRQTPRCPCWPPSAPRTCPGRTFSTRPNGSGRRSITAPTRRKGPPRSATSGPRCGPAAEPGVAQRPVLGSGSPRVSPGLPGSPPAAVLLRRVEQGGAGRLPVLAPQQGDGPDGVLPQPGHVLGHVAELLVGAPDLGGALRPLGLVDLVGLVRHHDVTPREPRGFGCPLLPVSRHQAPTIEITVKACAGASDKCPTSGAVPGLRPNGRGLRAGGW